MNKQKQVKTDNVINNSPSINGDNNTININLGNINETNQSQINSDNINATNQSQSISKRKRKQCKICSFLKALRKWIPEIAMIFGLFVSALTIYDRFFNKSDNEQGKNAGFEIFENNEQGENAGFEILEDTIIVPPIIPIRQKYTVKVAVLFEYVERYGRRLYIDNEIAPSTNNYSPTMTNGTHVIFKVDSVTEGKRSFSINGKCVETVFIKENNQQVIINCN